MAKEHFLKFFQMPEKPSVYTGLFQNYQERTWSDKPNKAKHGVSYTKYADAMDIRCGNMSLFGMFHGKCWYYAQFFKLQNPDWEIVNLMRAEGSWNENIHTFCTKEQDGIRLFADARGVTDDPLVFIEDFNFGKGCRLIGEGDSLEPTWFGKEYMEAYNYIFHLEETKPAA